MDGAFFPAPKQRQPDPDRTTRATGGLRMSDLGIIASPWLTLACVWLGSRISLARQRRADRALFWLIHTQHPIVNLTSPTALQVSPTPAR